MAAAWRRWWTRRTRRSWPRRSRTKPWRKGRPGWSLQLPSSSASVNGTAPSAHDRRPADAMGESISAVRCAAAAAASADAVHATRAVDADAPARFPADATNAVPSVPAEYAHHGTAASAAAAVYWICPATAAVWRWYARRGSASASSAPGGISSPHRLPLSSSTSIAASNCSGAAANGGNGAAALPDAAWSGPGSSDAAKPPAARR
mmetsp:Transcript_29451/g.85699  ORF Transcript_29451/g.85699 Transcript_29451/m.85699 type:complete len:206 (+) Transcript_29451:1480-2097(+)